jgi:hypothetical protein
MASPAHINRMNAQQSTGPTSVEGKAVTRFNAMKHGLDAASLVIPGEDPAEFARLAEDLHRELKPRGPLETELVETVIRSTWFQHRYARVEAQLYAAIFKKMDDPEATLGDAFHYDACGANVLGKVFRRQQAARRDFDKALAELRRVQKARQDLQLIQLPKPATAPRAEQHSGPHPKPTPGQPWLGSEPLSWRL